MSFGDMQMPATWLQSAVGIVSLEPEQKAGSWKQAQLNCWLGRGADEGTPGAKPRAQQELPNLKVKNWLRNGFQRFLWLADSHGEGLAKMTSR